MDNQITSLERAFELASSGKCTTVGELKAKLKQEGRDTDQITGSTLLRQLRDIMKTAAATKAG